MTNIEVAPVTNRPVASAPSQRRDDLHHDPWLVPLGEDFEALVNEVFELMEASCPRPKRQRSDATQRRRDTLANVMANLAVLQSLGRNEAGIAISAKKTGTRVYINGTLRPSRYYRQAQPQEVLLKVVDELESLGLITRQRGSRRGGRTTIWPTFSLAQGLAPEGVPLPLTRLSGAEAIILKAPEPTTSKRRHWEKKPKVLVEYEDTDETRLMRTEMAAINTALGSVDIKFDGKRQPLVHLTRRFQIEHPQDPPRFDRHGRLYDGFWEYLRKEQRGRITIDGHPVAEADFSGFFVQACYAEAGIELPPGDPYSVDGLAREDTKAAMSALLCKNGPMRQLPESLEHLRLAGWTGRKVQEAMSRKHPAIAHLFGHGTGMKLMFIESSIMVEVLLRLISRGVAALPLHDGLIAQSRCIEECAATMAEVSEHVLGKPLIVSIKNYVR